MVIVLPKQGRDMGTAEPAEKLAALFAAIGTAKLKRVALELPRFKASHTASNLASRFQAAGMSDAFDPAAADFSGMTGRSRAEAPLHLQRILHRAVIDVTEEGTEAAAATVVVPFITAAPVEAEPVPFRVDRPFEFFIHDSTINSILFQGRIIDPRG